MILVVDIGNTNILIGVYQNEKLISTYRTLTDKRKSSDDYAINMRIFLDKISSKVNIRGAIISSVVPILTNTIKKAISSLFNIRPLIVSPKIKSGVLLKMDNPCEVGADLISVSVGAIKKYGYPSLIIDLGTATKIISIDNKGSFVGGVVMPGIKISMEALVGKTAQLPEVSLEAPKLVIGKNTFDSMKSGIVYGHISAIEGTIKRMEEELGYTTKHILTGGYAKVVRDHLDTDMIFDEFLILEGLLYIYLKNNGEKNVA